MSELINAEIAYEKTQSVINQKLEGAAPKALNFVNAVVAPKIEKAIERGTHYVAVEVNGPAQNIPYRKMQSYRKAVAKILRELGYAVEFHTSGTYPPKTYLTVRWNLTEEQNPVSILEDIQNIIDQNREFGDPDERAIENIEDYIRTKNKRGLL